MRVAVLGAGAVGCYFGGMLARAGHAVALIGRPAHVDAIRADGLRLEARAFDERIAVEASTAPQAVRGAELVLFCVKSMASEEAASEMAPFLEPGALVLNLQNGVDNAERIQSRIRQPVIPAVVYVATEMAGPGHVKHHGRGDLVIGPLDPSLPRAALERIQQVFEAAGVPVALSENVLGELWAKLVVNCAYNALSAITQLPYGAMIQGAGIREVMRDVVEEALAVAKAGGVRMAADMLARTYAIAEAMPAQYSSTAQDLARGKPTEIDHLNGYLVRRGEALGVPTPVNRVLHALVQLLERKADGKRVLTPFPRS
ncbi:MAG TPA: 2-dehydropantoate 2-reductase [Burkholderiales bacterium]|nr:2-dehydropantoate 2-reductase [Burkholderiales bacterium]